MNLNSKYKDTFVKYESNNPIMFFNNINKQNNITLRKRQIELLNNRNEAKVIIGFRGNGISYGILIDALLKSLMNKKEKTMITANSFMYCDSSYRELIYIIKQLNIEDCVLEYQSNKIVFKNLSSIEFLNYIEQLYNACKENKAMSNIYIDNADTITSLNDKQFDAFYSKNKENNCSFTICSAATIRWPINAFSNSLLSIASSNNNFDLLIWQDSEEERYFR